MSVSTCRLRAASASLIGSGRIRGDGGKAVFPKPSNSSRVVPRGRVAIIVTRGRRRLRLTRVRRRRAASTRVAPRAAAQGRGSRRPGLEPRPDTPLGLGLGGGGRLGVLLVHVRRRCTPVRVARRAAAR
eukprot:scaffold73041_cov54-Phaeocystis_antarctica.AAC.4